MFEENYFDLKNINSFSKIMKGSSNQLYKLHIGNDDFILRSPPNGFRPITGHNMHREYLFVKEINKYSSLAPKAIAFFPNHALTNSHSFIMENIEGVIPRKNFPELMKVTSNNSNEVCYNFIDTLLEIHNIPIHSFVENTSKADHITYRQRQVEGWIKRFHNSKTKWIPDFKKIISFLESNFPTSQRIFTITHNDFKFDNLVYDNKNPINPKKVLDWELAAIGCPLMDLGSALAYWIEKNDPLYLKLCSFLPTTKKGMLSRKELALYYLEKSPYFTTSDLSLLNYFYIFGLFKLATIASQIFKRFTLSGETNKNAKFYFLGIHALSMHAKKSIRYQL